MTSPITEQARQIASTAIQEKPASLDSSRASSFLGTDKPATVRKWFPTGNLAWRIVPDDEDSMEALQFTDHGHWPTSSGYPAKGGCYELVQELFEVEINLAADHAERTGNIQWRTIPILPADAPVSKCAEIIIPAFDSPLLNQTAAEDKP
jgi:hypothetical protein